MNLSRKWLSEFADINASSKEYEDAMTLSGSKVELTRELSEEIKNVIVGRVVKMERHPDSDHMWVCQLDVNRGEPVQIVTGAQNVNEGDLVPVAMHKSLLAGGVKITKGKLRGIASNGMLCSIEELGLDTHDAPEVDYDGIWIINHLDCKPGDDIRPIIGMDDSVVEFEITNNRPDCLSVLGLARESAVTFDTELKLHDPVVKGGAGDINEHLSIEIQNPDLCPRYTARMIKNIKIEPSPMWMRQRLRSAGVRPINNIVDITNYVMLEYGQPMHAFDYACLDDGKIIVRNAGENEITNTLDGTERTLTSDMLVIADAKKAVGIAGVMGGENSEITENTKFAVFESANFFGTSIRRTAAALNMRTDASSRFEKGLDPQNTLPAVERACELVEMLGAGEVLDGIIDIVAKPYAPRTLKLEPAKINKLLGTNISENFMRECLVKLGFTFDGDMMTIPSWRDDVEHYSDIAEEVARFYGYNEIEPTVFKTEASVGGFTDKQIAEKEISRVCRAMGYSEIITYSFIGPSDYDRVAIPSDSPLRDSTVILNPLGEDTSIMRTTSLPSMLNILARNKNFRNESAQLFELAKVYRKSGETLPDERLVITLGAYGGMDFFALKGAVETLFAEMRVSGLSYTANAENPSYHSGRCAVVAKGDTVLGTFGQIHPSVAAEYGLSEAYAAEIDFGAILECRTAEQKFIPIPKYPAIQRDIAVVCDADTTIAELETSIRKGGKLLRDVKLFDIYTGNPIPAGKKSVAFSLSLRSDEQTLTDELADETIKSVLKHLETELGAVIR